jgi:hypothetical protein
MRQGAFVFSGEWVAIVRSLPETGMGYTVATVKLREGRIFEQVIIEAGRLTRVRGLPTVPFTEHEIAEITPTHETWDWTDIP